jgi:hypothetical protein
MDEEESEGKTVKIEKSLEEELRRGEEKRNEDAGEGTAEVIEVMKKN